MDSEARHRLIAERVADRLGALAGPWLVEGDRIMGPTGSAVTIGDQHAGCGPDHVDLGFVFPSVLTQPHVVWSCATGLRGTLEERLLQAVDAWVDSAGVCCLDFVVQRGLVAHVDGDDPFGLRGWHVLHSGTAFGDPEDNRTLLGWVTDTPILPALARALESELEPATLNGVKLLFGGDDGELTAEVRVNDVRADAASAALASLDWPRPRRVGFVRLFILAVPRSDPWRWTRSDTIIVLAAIALLLVFRMIWSFHRP